MAHSLVVCTKVFRKGRRSGRDARDYRKRVYGKEMVLEHRFANLERRLARLGEAVRRFGTAVPREEEHGSTEHDEQRC